MGIFNFELLINITIIYILILIHRVVYRALKIGCMVTASGYYNHSSEETALNAYG